MRERPRPDDPGIREAWDLSVQNMERFAAVDAPKARAEAEHLLERVQREFADVPMAQFMVDGPGRVQLSRFNSPEAKTKTYGASWPRRLSSSCEISLSASLLPTSKEKTPPAADSSSAIIAAR